MAITNKKTVKFTGRVVRKVFGDSADFRIYAMDVPEEQIQEQNLKKTKYGSVAILGSLHELGDGLEYSVEATEENGRNGYSYRVINITRNRPQNAQDFHYFLNEILTPLQAEAIWNAYPDFVQRVIDNRLDDIDLSKLHNIGVVRFTEIKEKIINNYALAELIQEFKGLLSMSVIRQIYNRYASVQAVREALKKDPYKCLCQLSGIGFKTADSIIQEFEKEKVIEFDYELKTSKQRCLAATMYLLEENETNGNTRMGIVELRSQIIKFVPACSDKFVEAIKDDLIYYDKEKLVISLKTTYNTEKYISEKVKEALKINREWETDTSKYGVVDGFELTDEQKKLTQLICKNQIMILNGSAGVGKSATTQSAINMCKDLDKTFLLLAPTGRASKVLAEYTKEKASTIHRGLDYNPTIPGGWGYNEENQLPYDFVICDEFSMCDIFLFKHLIEAIDFTQTKLLLVGDNAQIPSVSAGNLLHDFMNSKVIPMVTLDKVFRYASGGLLKVATDIRKGNKYLNGLTSVMTSFGEDYTFINCPDEKLIDNVVALYKKILSEEFQKKRNINISIEDVQVITSKNVGDYGTIALNNRLQKIANKNYGSNTFFKVGETVYYEGDLVLQTANNYHAKIYLDEMEVSDVFDCYDEYGFNKKEKETLITNGETGKITSINTKEQYLIINFDGVEVMYFRNDMQNVSLGYSLTTFKAQGSGIKIPIIITPRSHIFMENNNLLYVALTRTKMICFHLSTPDTINMCLPKKANFIRNTFMKDLLN